MDSKKIIRRFKEYIYVRSHENWVLGKLGMALLLNIGFLTNLDYLRHRTVGYNGVGYGDANHLNSLGIP